MMHDAGMFPGDALLIVEFLLPFMVWGLACSAS